MQQSSFNIPVFQVLLSCICFAILLINPVGPLYSFFQESVCFLPVLCLFVFVWIQIHPPPKTDRGKRSPDVIYSLNTSCSFQSPWLIHYFSCLLRWVPVGPVSVDCAGEICEMEQTRLETQKTRLKHWHFNFTWAFYFVFILSNFLFSIRN